MGQIRSVFCESDVQVPSRWMCLSVIAGSLIASCSSSTEPTVENLLEHQQIWNAQGLTHYTYDYLIGPGFLNQFAGRSMRLEVSQGVVVSAIFVASGEPVPGPASQLPTIDTLFAQSLALVRSGNLKRIAFDASRGYPSSIDIAGPPDASGRLAATNLQRLP